MASGRWVCFFIPDGGGGSNCTSSFIGTAIVIGIIGYGINAAGRSLLGIDRREAAQQAAVQRAVAQTAKIDPMWGLRVSKIDDWWYNHESSPAYWPKQGILIQSAVPSSPAAKAGLEYGLIIVKADGKAVHTVESLNHVISSHASKTLTLRVVKNTYDGPKTRSVTLER